MMSDTWNYPMHIQYISIYTLNKNINTCFCSHFSRWIILAKEKCALTQIQTNLWTEFERNKPIVYVEKIFDFNLWKMAAKVLHLHFCSVYAQPISILYIGISNEIRKLKLLQILQCSLYLKNVSSFSPPERDEKRGQLSKQAHTCTLYVCVRESEMGNLCKQFLFVQFLLLQAMFNLFAMQMQTAFTFPVSLAIKHDQTSHLYLLCIGRFM